MDKKSKVLLAIIMVAGVVSVAIMSYNTLVLKNFSIVTTIPAKN